MAMLVITRGYLFFFVGWFKLKKAVAFLTLDFCPLFGGFFIKDTGDVGDFAVLWGEGCR